MKRITILKAAASLGVAASLASPASAQVESAVLNQAFGASKAWEALKTGGSTTTTTTGSGATATSQITETSASGGKVGTFTFSGSEGDSQRFAVGTSTNMGVNASASSTKEYKVDSTGTFGFATSNLKQTIGTSGLAEQTQARETAANSFAQSKVSSELGETLEKAIEKSKASSSSNSGGGGWWWWYQSNYGNKTTLSEDEKQEVTKKYNEAKTAVNETAKSEFFSSSHNTENSNGVISGTFVSDTTFTPPTPPLTPEAFTSDKATNNVTVKGIGNAANVVAGSDSKFNTTITARTSGEDISNSATASGSAGGNVNTTASADASRSQFTSIFMQSF